MEFCTAEFFSLILISSIIQFAPHAKPNVKLEMQAERDKPYMENVAKSKVAKNE